VKKKLDKEQLKFTLDLLNKQKYFEDEASDIKEAKLKSIISELKANNIDANEDFFLKLFSRQKFEKGLLDYTIKALKKFNYIDDHTFDYDKIKLRTIFNELRDKRIYPGEDFFIELSTQLKLQYFDPELLKDIHYLASALPYHVMRNNLIFLLQITSDKVVIATSNPFNFQLFRELERLFKKRIEIYLATTESIEFVLDRGWREMHSEKAMSDLLLKNPEYSASRVLYSWQRNTFAVFFFAFLSIFTIAPSYVFYILFIAINLMYFLINPFKLLIALKGFENIRRKVNITDDEVNKLTDDELPVYTILIPVFKEAEVIPNIITNINNLDYPKDKLDVKLLVEELDGETLDAARKFGLLGEPEVTIGNIPIDTYKQLTKLFDVLIIPDSEIKTKPRACNYGLFRARGEYIVIYDAEDDPEPDQLKKAYLAFRDLGDEYACFQAHLNFYNPRENILARWFSLEYAFWFDYWLQGLDISGAPLPLGGTSNHFKTSRLKELGAWDPYNVTEDADLGVRISQNQFKTAMLNSYTLEEANIKLGNWIRQRSRWIKGYAQTFFVHMRHPSKLVKKLGAIQSFYFILTFGFNILFPLINPILWLVTILNYAFPETMGALFVPEVKTICEFNLILGNLVYIVLHLGPSIIRKEYFNIPIALFIPVYWVLISYAAWKGIFQLVTKPFYWEKTQHGLTSYKSYADLKQIEKVMEKVKSKKIGVQTS